MQGKRVVVLTGAGISAESGIRTFRDDGGLWENHRWRTWPHPKHGEPTPAWCGGSIKRADANSTR